MRWLFACGMLLIAAFQAGAQEPPPLPRLPERHDTLSVAIGNAVIGRGVMTWTRRGLEQLQVYTWTSALDGSSIIDSLSSYPTTLRPVREVRVAGDTSHTIIFGRDTLWITIDTPGSSVTSRAAAPAATLYSSASIEGLVATMPFERGARRAFLVYFAPPAQLGARYVEVRVDGEESLDGRQAWRVHAATPGGGTTYWVDARTRTILQSDVREGDVVITFRRSVPDAP